MIYTNEQAKLIKQKQKRDAETKTADLKRRANDLAERREIEADLKAMGLWDIADVEGAL